MPLPTRWIPADLMAFTVVFVPWCAASACLNLIKTFVSGSVLGRTAGWQFSYAEREFRSLLPTLSIFWSSRNGSREYNAKA